MFSQQNTIFLPSFYLSSSLPVLVSYYFLVSSLLIFFLLLYFFPRYLLFSFYLLSFNYYLMFFFPIFFLCSLFYFLSVLLISWHFICFLSFLLTISIVFSFFLYSLRLDNNIESKSFNNTYLKIIKIFNKLLKKLNMIQSWNLITTSTLGK